MADASCLPKKVAGTPRTIHAVSGTTVSGGQTSLGLPYRNSDILVSLESLTGSAYLAAGSGGVHHVKLYPKVAGKQIIKTESTVYDVQIEDGKIFVAEGKGGLSVWELNSQDKPKIIGRYLPPEGGVYQVVIGRYIGFE